MSYKEFIDNILNTRGRFACGNEYHERHHIIPKCLGGTNDEDNLIDLYAREHFEAHRLLALENPKNKKLVYAFSMMAFPQNKYHNRELTSEEFEEARILFGRLQKGMHSGEKNPMYGKSGKDSPNYGKHHTEETKRKISNSHKGRHLSEETKKKLSELNKGKKHSEESKKKMSQSRTGQMNWNYGKHLSEKTKKKIGMANSKSVRCIETDKIYKSTIDAEKKTGINKHGIRKVCNGKHKTAGGYHWEFINREENQKGE